MLLLDLLILYILFRIKHFLCDFIFQTSWMAITKGQQGTEAYKALFSHAAIHAIGTTAIVLLFAPNLWFLGVLDFVVHSAVDRLKGVVTEKKGWKPKDTLFWWAFAIDQEAHNFTHLAYIIVIYFYGIA